jgi:hypothetical protein
MTAPSRRSLNAIALGFLLDTGGSLVSGAFLGAILGFALNMQGGPAQDAADVLSESPMFMAASIFLGCLFTFLGSFVAAKAAGREEILHALAVGLLGIAVPTAFADSPYPRSVEIVSRLLVVAMAVLAGIVARPRRHAIEGPADDEPTVGPPLAAPPCPAPPPPARPPPLPAWVSAPESPMTGSTPPPPEPPPLFAPRTEPPQPLPPSP